MFIFHDNILSMYIQRSCVHFIQSRAAGEEMENRVAVIRRECEGRGGKGKRGGSSQ